jgi:hypothetical protein
MANLYRRAAHAAAVQESMPPLASTTARCFGIIALPKKRLVLCPSSNDEWPGGTATRFCVAVVTPQCGNHGHSLPAFGGQRHSVAVPPFN